MKTKKLSLLFVLFAAILLSACSSPKEDPETVIQKFKMATSEIQSGDLGFNVVMKGADAQDNLDLKGNMDLKFDRENELEPKADLTVELSGNIQTAGRALSGELDFTFRSIANQFYLRLDKLDSSDSGLQAFTPFLSLYKGKWLKLAEELIPENVRKLQGKTPEERTKEEEFKKAFRDADLFTVTKEFGVETINGNEAYHYAVSWNENGVKDYLQKIAALSGPALPQADLAQSLEMLRAISNTELWIGTEDYFLYKGLATFLPASESDVQTQIELTLQGNSYNEKVKIKAPEDAQEFNPLDLFQFNPAGALKNEEPEAPVKE